MLETCWRSSHRHLIYVFSCLSKIHMKEKTNLWHGMAERLPNVHRRVCVDTICGESLILAAAAARSLCVYINHKIARNLFFVDFLLRNVRSSLRYWEKSVMILLIISFFDFPLPRSLSHLSFYTISDIKSITIDLCLLLSDLLPCFDAKQLIQKIECDFLFEQTSDGA